MQSFFSGKLSQRMRTLRHRANDKSPKERADGAPTLKKMKLDVRDSSTMSHEDYEQHLNDLKTEWVSQKRNDRHIKALMFQTKAKRHSWIQTHPSPSFKEILAVFPCFEEGQYVSIVVI